MELRERLSRLGYFGQAPSPPLQPDSTPPREHVAVREARARPPSALPDIGDLVEGSYRVAGDGGCFVAEASYPLDHVHGGAVVSDLLGHAGETFAFLSGDPRLAGLDPTRAVLVDCETTGLSGGTGTYAFLIGVGYFADGVFRVEQFFMRDPAEERATLSVLSSVLARFDAVITFNGKCFDWPLLDTRHIYARVPLHPRQPLHLDLLFPARRLFKRRIGSCSLDALESRVLGIPPREQDVPGWMIPTLYFDYLRQRDGRALVPVFAHNHADILAMLALAILMAGHVVEPTGPSGRHPSDLFCLGRLFEDAGALERAVYCYEHALVDADDARDRSDLLARLAGTYKRLRDAERAVALWEALVAEGAASIYPYVELSKHFEHRQRAYERALDLTRTALALHARTAGLIPPGRHAAERADLEKRAARLVRKLGA